MIKKYLINILAFVLFIIGGFKTIAEDKWRYRYYADLNLDGYGWMVGLGCIIAAFIFISPLIKEIINKR